MKPSRSREDDHLQVGYEEFREYRFGPDFCEGADPESKGIVENLIGYAKSDLLIPLLLGDNLDLDEGNDAANAWCSRCRNNSPPLNPGRFTRLQRQTPPLIQHDLTHHVGSSGIRSSELRHRN